MGDMNGPKPPRTAAIGPQPSIGESSLGAAVSHLHKEHPHPTHGEGLQNKATTAIHYPVGSVYKGKM
jgi:hypothetical protein